MGVTNGIVVVEIWAFMNQNMIDSCAEQAWHLQFEEASDLVGKKCKKAIDEEKEDQHPFKHSINQEVREATQFLLYKTFEGSFRRHDPGREMHEMLIQVESFEDEMEMRWSIMTLVMQSRPIS
ncbi:hypothetical protein SLA2020_009720 [Shorea laevis]